MFEETYDTSDWRKPPETEAGQLRIRIAELEAALRKIVNGGGHDCYEIALDALAGSGAGKEG